MTRTVDVLLLSTSTIHYTEGDPRHTLVALLEDALREKEPGVEWCCRGGLLYVTPTMAERARRMVEEKRPQAAIVRPTGNAFMHDEVVSRIRERWPALYPLAMRLADFFRDLGGSKRRGADGLRGELFRIPRRLAVKLIGQAPRIRVERAVEYVQETLEALLPMEDVEVVCFTSVGNSETLLPPQEHERRKEYFLQTLEAYCRLRQIPFMRDNEIVREAGAGYVYGEDQWHSTLPFRQLDARAMADQVIRALGRR
jgi:hypothetical protein